MKKITLWICMGSVVCLLSGCAKKELERMTDSTEEKKEELLMEYKFTQNGISTVDIGESKEMILAFRHFNNAINSKTQSNFSKQLENYRKVIAGALSPTNEALRYLGYGKSTPDEKTKELLLSCGEELKKVVDGKFIYKVWLMDNLKGLTLNYMENLLRCI